MASLEDRIPVVDSRYERRRADPHVARRDNCVGKAGWQPDIRGLAMFALLALSVSIAMAFGVTGIADRLSASAIQVFDLPNENRIASTPASEWRKGEMPYLYQTDEKWASAPYAGGTVGDSGCGPTCLTMAYVYLTGKKNKTPKSMAEFSEKNGFVEGGLTTWEFMTRGARKLGLESRELPADRVSIVRALNRGNPVVVSVSKGDFTQKGHFIVMCRIDSNNRIVIRDPNSPENSRKSWELSRIIKQASNFWEISA